MPSKNLSAKSMKVISNYLHLPIPGHSVCCPYFNNKRNKVRAGLRVLLGKGSSDDICKEIKLIALRDKIDLEKISDSELSKLLVEKNIGIDCSGFAYYILDQELKEKGKGSLRKALYFPFAKNPIRKFLILLRPVENTNVKTLSHEKNSKEISFQAISPGDMIVLLSGNKFSNPDHIMIVHEVEYDNKNLKTIRYTHSYRWPSDGQYFHGVRQGHIEITDKAKNILEQKWIEQGVTGEANKTFVLAKEAGELKIMRLNVF